MNFADSARSEITQRGFRIVYIEEYLLAESDGDTSMANLEPIPYANDVEAPPSDEGDDIRQVIEALEKILKLSRERSGRFQGDVHVKVHGCATAEFRVLPNLPAGLAQGVFAHERTFSAAVRFSNSASQPQPDYVPDGRGMAIKLLGVPGERLSSEANGAPTQDFVMVNHPVFIARNVKDFLRIEQILADGKNEKLTTVKEGLTGGDWNPLHWHWREALTVIQIAGRLPAHPASNTYFSMAPIRYGKYVAKYRAKPAGELSGSFLDLVTKLGREPDALRLMLEETLRSQQVLFEFQVQLRTSEKTMPVEDATVQWPESDSPYRTVALLLIPRQEMNTEEQKAVCKQLSFNVWHALADHRPLGGINRLRREVYPASAAWRRNETEVR
jgi:catalase